MFHKSRDSVLLQMYTQLLAQVLAQSRWSINMRDRKKEGEKEDRKMVRRKGNVMTKLKTEMSMSYTQMGWRWQLEPCCAVV